MTTRQRKGKGTRSRSAPRPVANVVSDAFYESLTRGKPKNGPLEARRGWSLDWEEYIEWGYDPMDADWCLAMLATFGVRFGLDAEGEFWFDTERLAITPGMRCSIDYRHDELTAILQGDRQ